MARGSREIAAIVVATALASAGCAAATSPAAGEARRPPSAGEAAAAPRRAPQEASAAPLIAGPADVKNVNQPGEWVALADILEPGKITVVDFWAAWCAPCKVMEEKLVAAIGGRAGVAIRKVDIGDDTSPVAAHYQVDVLPDMRIYRADGSLAHVLVGLETERAGPLVLELLAGQKSAADQAGLVP